MFTKGDIFFGQHSSESPSTSNPITKRPARSSCDIEKKRMKKLSTEPLFTNLLADCALPDKEDESNDEMYQKLLNDFQQEKRQHEEMVSLESLLVAFHYCYL